MSNGTTRENQASTCECTMQITQVTKSSARPLNAWKIKEGVLCLCYTYIVTEVPDTQLKENILVCAQVCYGHRFQAVQEVPVYLPLNIPWPAKNFKAMALQTLQTFQHYKARATVSTRPLLLLALAHTCFPEYERIRQIINILQNVRKCWTSFNFGETCMYCIVFWTVPDVQ